MRQTYAQKIQLRLTFYFLLILLPLVIVSLYVNFRSQNILLERTVERTTAALASSMDYMELSLENIQIMSTVTASDNNLLRKLSSVRPVLDAEAYITFAEVMTELVHLTSINQMVSHASLFHSPSQMLLTADRGGKRLKDAQVLDNLRKLAVRCGTGIMYIMPDYPLAEGQTFGSVIGTDSISLIRVMDLNNPDREPSLLVLSLNKTRLVDLIESLLPSPNAQIYLYTNKRELIASAGSYGARIADFEAEIPGMLALKAHSPENWTLLLLQPEKELWKEVEETRLFTYIIIAVSVFLALLIAWAVYSGIAHPVQRLWKGMNAAGRGDFNVRLDNDRIDEIGSLTRAFNKMVGDQKELIENHYEQHLRLSNTELKFLQSQINPHFLYNTLDSIYRAAQNYEASEISEMVLNLSRFFRLSLSKGRDTFTVEETVTHLHYYIRIQQLRFLEAFTVRYELQEESKPVHVLKLLLQPLVENAILYGLENKADGELSISSRVEEEFLILSVKDNGAGISKERMEYIREQLGPLSDANAGLLSFSEANPSDVYGLRNVYSRIKLFYGDRAELTIDSVEGERTIVELKLPLEHCRESFDLKPLRNIQHEVHEHESVDR
ncbi:sensor histidine kinase [Paenibacillus contaminans]|uniref:sensor histidine kinase n=1 Tax=Paenibacillus contaminans TaxID=450362 RepID=UPI001EDEFAEB|nr:sensor histidine kinase [Paenibacillus contaminans]